MTLSRAGHPHVSPETGLSRRLSLLRVACTLRRPWEQDLSGDRLFQTGSTELTYG